MQFTLTGSTLTFGPFQIHLKRTTQKILRLNWVVCLFVFLNVVSLATKKFKYPKYFFFFLKFEVFSFCCSQMWVRGSVPLTPVPAV